MGGYEIHVAAPSARCFPSPPLSRLPLRTQPQQVSGHGGVRETVAAPMATFLRTIARPCDAPAQDELTLEGIRQFYIAIEKEEWKLGITIFFVLSIFFGLSS